MTKNTAAQVHHVTHPLVQHKLTLMRNKDASSTTFRTLLGELAALMAYEITRDMPTQLVEIETPLANPFALDPANPLHGSDALYRAVQQIMQGRAAARD